MLQGSSRRRTGVALKASPTPQTHREAQDCCLSPAPSASNPTTKTAGTSFRLSGHAAHHKPKNKHTPRPVARHIFPSAVTASHTANPPLPVNHRHTTGPLFLPTNIQRSSTPCSRDQQLANLSPLINMCATATSSPSSPHTDLAGLSSPSLPEDLQHFPPRPHSTMSQKCRRQSSLSMCTSEPSRNHRGSISSSEYPGSSESIIRTAPSQVEPADAEPLGPSRPVRTSMVVHDHRNQVSQRPKNQALTTNGVSHSGSRPPLGSYSAEPSSTKLIDESKPKQSDEMQRVPSSDSDSDQGDSCEDDGPCTPVSHAERERRLRMWGIASIYDPILIPRKHRDKTLRESARNQSLETHSGSFATHTNTMVETTTANANSHQIPRPILAGDALSGPTLFSNIQNPGETSIETLLHITDVESFIQKPVAQGTKILCKIVRHKEGVEKLFPWYELFVEGPNETQAFLMSARKRKRSKVSQYVLFKTRFSGALHGNAVASGVRSGSRASTAFASAGNVSSRASTIAGRAPSMASFPNPGPATHRASSILNSAFGTQMVSQSTPNLVRKESPPEVIGKVKSNFIGTTFVAYSRGRNPFKRSRTRHTGSRERRREKGSLESERNLSDTETKNAVTASIGAGCRSRTQSAFHRSPWRGASSHNLVMDDRRTLGAGNVSDEDELDASLPVREELCMVNYDPNILGFKGPRKMKVIMPGMTRAGDRIEFRPKTEKDTLVERSKQEAGDHRLLVLHNKSPQWNEDTHSYVLNFNGRVTLASVKNFQIVHDDDLDYIIMQFGRVSADTFSMDFQYPMSPLQAFAVALTSFDAKLACE